jgi:hypothetical protein
MWPYNNDEASWLMPKAAAPAIPKPSNDNDPTRRVPPRPLPDQRPKPGRE